jgi:Rhs element Vgr protein
MSTVTATIESGSQVMPVSYGLLSIDILKEVNRIPHAQIVLLDGDSAKQKFEISDDPFFEPGKPIQIKLRYEDDPGSEHVVFRGLVVKQVVEASSQGTQLSVELKDAAIKLTQSRRSEVYYGKTDKKIIGELIERAGLKAGTLEDTQPVHPELVQYYCTDWDFIVSRAEACGLLVVAEGGEVSLRKIVLNGQPERVHTYEFGISPVYDFEIEVDASHQRASVESIAWDLKNHKLTQASKAQAFALTQGNLKAEDLAASVGGQVEVLSSPVPLSLNMLQTWADAVMVRSRMAMIRGRMAVPGFGNVHCLDGIRIDGVGKRFNGATLVTGVRQRVGLQGWQTDLQFGLSPERFAERRDVKDLPAAGLLPAVNGLQVGIVDQFDEDPDKEFRVKVILPGIHQTRGAVWARLATPDAGNARGYFFRPEPGDEVVVGFFNDDPRQAVVLGAMYGSRNAPPQSTAALTANNIEKGIFTRKGTILGFSDKEKPSVFLSTPNANKILFDDEAEVIHISDQHGNSIQMSKKGIEISSAKDVTIKAAGKVDIIGKKVNVK